MSISSLTDLWKCFKSTFQPLFAQCGAHILSPLGRNMIRALHQCFFCSFILVYKNLLFLYDMREFVLVLVAGRSLKKGFLLSVSQVLLRCILFREDISSIADIFSFGHMRTLAFDTGMCNIYFLYYVLLLLMRIEYIIIFRTLIEPLLYK